MKSLYLLCVFLMCSSCVRKNEEYKFYESVLKELYYSIVQVEENLFINAFSDNAEDCFVGRNGDEVLRSLTKSSEQLFVLDVYNRKDYDSFHNDNSLYFCYAPRDVVHDREMFRYLTIVFACDEQMTIKKVMCLSHDFTTVGEFVKMKDLIEGE